MTGILSMPAQQSEPTPQNQQANTINDKNLSQIAGEVGAKVPQNLQQPYLAIVNSGMQIMFGPQTSNLLRSRLTKALQSQNHAAALGDVIARLIVLISKESKGQMQLPAAIPAAVVLLCHMLDYAEKADHLQVTPELIAASMQSVVANTLKYCGVGPQQIMQAKQSMTEGGA